MTTPNNAELWSAVVETAGLSIPEEQRESFQVLTSDIQGLIATLRDTGLGETPPSFAFRAQ